MTRLRPGRNGDALEAALAEEPRIVVASACVFGSVAEGRAHRQSDIDVALLLVRAAHPSASDRFEARLHLSARLADRLGRPVDVVILNDAAPGLGRHVVTRGARVERLAELRRHLEHLRAIRPGSAAGCWSKDRRRLPTTQGFDARHRDAVAFSEP